jgi:hypothetical protein
MRHIFLALLAVVGLAPSARAEVIQLIANGGFETNDFTGWNAAKQNGSDGSLLVVPNNGGDSPLSEFSYALNPGGGNFFAITDQIGPGSYSLTQSFTIPAQTYNVTVSFQLFANDWLDVVASPASNRDYTTPVLNQNAEVDILTGTAGAFTSNPSDIVSTLYGPGADNLAGNPNPWTSYTDNLGALAPGTYQIRFAETDNQGSFNLGVDNVSVQASVPEPVSISLFGVGLLAIAMIRGRHLLPPA